MVVYGTSSGASVSAGLPYSLAFALVFSILIAVLIGFAVVKYFDRKKKPIILNRGMIWTMLPISMGIEILSALFLLSTDNNLITYAPLHWAGLLIFTMVNVILGTIYLFSKVSSTAPAIAIWSIFGVFVMLLDAGLNFPLSQWATSAGSAVGFQYFFGFGVIGGGSAGVSLAFSLLLVFAFVSFFAALMKVKAMSPRTRSKHARYH